MSALSIFLSIWGSSLATILAVIKIREYWASSRKALLVTTRINENGLLDLTAANIGRRPVSIAAIAAAYGTSSQECTTFFSVDTDTTKLMETDTFPFSLVRSELVEAASKIDGLQKYRCRLFVIIHTTSGRSFTSLVNIPTNLLPQELIQDEFFWIARDWMATDSYLGFKKIESKKLHDIIQTNI